jgi:PleD family two-component response regulator
MEKLKTEVSDTIMFINRVDYELKRAERYSIFMSLVVYDMSFLRDKTDINYDKLSEVIQKSISKKVRVIDIVSLLGDNQIALLFPETNRQGAEIVSKRVNQVIKDCLEKNNLSKKDYVIPMEMASYPDTAGTPTISHFLQEFGNFNLK